MYSLDPPLREPDIKRTDLAQPPGGLRDGRFQVETAHLPLQNVIFALFRGPGWLREQSTSESSVLLMVGRNCMLPSRSGLSRTSPPEEIQGSRTSQPVLSDGSQHLLAGGSEGDGGAGGGQGGPKGEPRRPPPEPNPLLGQLAHAGWASSLTANLCLPQVGQSKRGTLVFERICSVHVSARICACKCRHTRGPVRAPRSVVSRKCRA